MNKQERERVLAILSLVAISLGVGIVVMGIQWLILVAYLGRQKEFNLYVSFDILIPVSIFLLFMTAMKRR